MRMLKAKFYGLFKSKFFIILMAAAVFLTVLPVTLAAMGRVDIVRSGANILAAPFRSAAVWCGDALSGFGEYFTEFERIKAENEELRQLLEAEKNKNDNADIAIEENEWLKNFLFYVSGEPKHTLLDAMTVSRSDGDFVTSFTINKGSLNGIEKGMAVVDEHGVLGYVSEAGLTYAKVSTLLGGSSSVGVICPRSGAYGLMDGSESYLSDGRCKLICPDENADIKEGDLIYTSGAGSIYPYGLAVGRVASVEKDPYSRKTVAYIEPLADLASPDRVMVIVNTENGEEVAK